MDEEPTLWNRIEPTLYGLALLIMNVGLAAAGLAAVYLLYGLFTGGMGDFNSLAKPDRVRVLGNVALAGSILKLGLGAAAVGGAFAFRNEESTGYLLGGVSALLALGIPYAVRTFVGASNNNAASNAALAAFIQAVLLPVVLAVALIILDVARRGIGAAQGGASRPEKHEFAYGAMAEAERRPIRTSLLAKCWEGGYCRDFIRPHCPIFIARKACWKERRGCYCEEEIVSVAAAKVQGVVLDMAPDPALNFANSPTAGAPISAPLPITFGSIGGGAVPTPAQAARPQTGYRRPELTPAQKRERCRNCVIYNEHQEEKYKLLMPATLAGGVALCLLFSPLMRHAVDGSLTLIQTIVNRASFGAGAPGVASQLKHPGETVEWVFVGAFTLMIVSKLLQAIEWACFKAKI